MSPLPLNLCFPFQLIFVLAMYSNLFSIRFIPEGSSVSVIKYYQVDEEVEEDHEPLGEHVDTGIMTLIRIRY
jgi:hypothetical protein